MLVSKDAQQAEKLGTSSSQKKNRGRRGVLFSASLGFSQGQVDVYDKWGVCRVIDQVHDACVDKQCLFPKLQRHFTFFANVQKSPTISHQLILLWYLNLRVSLAVPIHPHR